MKISEIAENTSAAFATSMGGGNGFANGGPGIIKRNKTKKKKKTESVTEAGLPPHLAKMFDKDGNKLKGSWKDGEWTADKKQPEKKKSKWIDATPPGYGPTDESVYAMNKEDPNNPEVLIQGYGRMPMDTLKRDIIKGIEEVLRNAEGDNWGTVSYAMYENGVLTAKVEALLNAINELEDIRKKGGPKSRGINKR